MGTLADQVREALMSVQPTKETLQRIREEMQAAVPGERGDIAELVVLVLAQKMREEGFVVVRRVEHDRGAVWAGGDREDTWMDRGCALCGKLGHVSYLAPSWQSWSWDVPGGKRKARWLMHGTYNSGDSYYECIWCGVGFTHRDLLDREGDGDFESELADWISSERAAGRTVVLEGEHPGLR
jgi:hypothetical protein